jgi:hypothetical protein
MSTRQRPRLIAVTSVLAFVLSACSSPKEEASQPAATKAQPSSGAAAGPTALEGFHDATTCQVIVGWVWDPNRPNQPLSVQISDEYTPIATVMADLIRPDLAAAGKGNGQHGFRYVVPASLKDGKPHTIRVSESSASFQLRGTPKQLNCPPE